MANLLRVARKELRDSVGDRIFLAVYIIFLIVMIFLIIPGAANYSSRIVFINSNWTSSDGTQDRFTDFDSPAIKNSLQTMITVLSFICPGIAVIISFSSINRELEDGSLKVSLSYPIYRDQIFLGKLLSGLILTFAASFSVILIGFALFIYLTGTTISLDLLSRIILVTVNTTLYMMLFFGIGLLFSIKFKNPVKSLILGVIVWILTVDVYDWVKNFTADILFGKHDVWGPIIERYLGILNDKISIARHEMFINIGNFLDTKMNYFKLMQSSLTTANLRTELGGVVGSDVYTGSVTVSNVYVGSILPELIIPFAMLVSYLVIIILVSYVLFNRMEIS